MRRRAVLDTRPHSITVRAGTLDDTSWMAQVAHLFLSECQTREQLSGECFDTMPGDFHPLIVKWRETWAN